VTLALGQKWQEQVLKQVQLWAQLQEESLWLERPVVVVTEYFFDQ
jgi:hypothetical protein